MGLSFEIDIGLFCRSLLIYQVSFVGLFQVFLVSDRQSGSHS